MPKTASGSEKRKYDDGSPDSPNSSSTPSSSAPKRLRKSTQTSSSDDEESNVAPVSNPRRSTRTTRGKSNRYKEEEHELVPPEDASPKIRKKFRQPNQSKEKSYDKSYLVATLYGESLVLKNKLLPAEDDKTSADAKQMIDEAKKCSAMSFTEFYSTVQKSYFDNFTPKAIKEAEKAGISLARQLPPNHPFPAQSPVPERYHICYDLYLNTLKNSFDKEQNDFKNAVDTGEKDGKSYVCEGKLLPNENIDPYGRFPDPHHLQGYLDARRSAFDRAMRVKEAGTTDGQALAPVYYQSPIDEKNPINLTEWIVYKAVLHVPYEDFYTHSFQTSFQKKAAELIPMVATSQGIEYGRTFAETYIGSEFTVDQLEFKPDQNVMDNAQRKFGDHCNLFIVSAVITFWRTLAINFYVPLSKQSMSADALNTELGKFEKSLNPPISAPQPAHSNLVRGPGINSPIHPAPPNNPPKQPVSLNPPTNIPRVQ